MTLEDKVWKTVLEAVYEYNGTMYGDNGPALRRQSNNEKRGIFYNALRRSFVNNMREYHLSEYLKCSSVQCSFREDCTLERFATVTYWNPAYMNDTTVHIGALLKKYGEAGFLNNIINVDLKRIKEFKFHHQ